ncbi:clathrin light chain B-like [Clytia hemisphaerica]|uniref:Clathrin light chain n=1 Tax=Clytia hemisphaerica TaxID=252671 RepID=A0A7M5USU7_9CNID|eukprot:TCONS_00070219-protein
MADLLGDDPAAEFLQQEEDQLRELGIDENQFGEDGAPPPDNGGADIMGQFEDLGNAPIDDGAPQEPVMNGFTEPAPAPIIPIQPAEEPESLKQWREEKADSLQKQEEEEVENHQQWTERAKKELDDWYNHYNEQLDKTKTENRSAEEQFIEEMTDTKPGNEWEKVSRFCDFNPKNSKNTKDVGRMRSILLQLKQNPLIR